MKRAWYVKLKENETYKNIPYGTILNITNDNYLWDIFLYNEEYVDHVDFEEKNFSNLDYIKVSNIDNIPTVVEFENMSDIIKDEQDKEEIAKELSKMEYGRKILAYIGVELNQLTVEQYQNLLGNNEIKTIQTLLSQGALESAHQLLMFYTPDDIITQLLLDKVQLQIQYYINQL